MTPPSKASERLNHYHESRMARLERTASAVSLMLLIALPFLLFMPTVLSSGGSFFVFPDAQEQTYAWWQKLGVTWHQGYLPLWDANVYAGRSFVGEFQASVLYPLTWLWLALFSTPDGFPQIALEAFVVLHFALAIGGMFLLLRHWGLGIVPGVFGASCYALLGPVAERAAAQPNIFFGLCWLPFALLATSQHLSGGLRRYAALAGAVMAMQVLSGHVQPAFHTALLSGVMCIGWHCQAHSAWRDRLRLIARSAWPMLAALLVLALPQWLLSLQYMADVYRWVGADAPVGPGETVPYRIFAYQHIVPPNEWWAAIDPWRIRPDDANTPYFSTIGLLLAAWFAWGRPHAGSLPRLQPHRRWMMWTAIAALIIVAGYVTPLPYVLRKLPVVGQIRELGRYVILFHVVGCVFAAAAVEMLGRDLPMQRARSVPAWLLPAIAISAVWLVFIQLLSVPALLALLAALAVMLIARPGVASRARMLPVAALAAALLTIWLYRPMALPPTEGRTPASAAFARLELLEQVEADYGLTRIIIEADAGLPKNYAEVHRLQSRLGHSATMQRPYFDFLAQDWSLHGEVNDLLNFGYVLTRGELDLPLMAQDASGLRLYRRPSAYPRVFLASRFRAEPGQRTPGGFEMLHYDDHRVAFTLESATDDVAVISEIDYPGWCATVNGSVVPIQRAQLQERSTPLRSVPVSAGRNDIELRYRPFASALVGCG